MAPHPLHNWRLLSRDTWRLPISAQLHSTAESGCAPQGSCLNWCVAHSCQLQRQPLGVEFYGNSYFCLSLYTGHRTKGRKRMSLSEIMRWTTRFSKRLLVASSLVMPGIESRHSLLVILFSTFLLFPQHYRLLKEAGTLH